MNKPPLRLIASTLCFFAPVIAFGGNFVWSMAGEAADVRPLLHAGIFLVAVCAVGFVLGAASLLLNRRPYSWVVLGLALVGMAVNGTILYFFAPPIVGLYL